MTMQSNAAGCAAAGAYDTIQETWSDKQITRLIKHKLPGKPSPTPSGEGAGQRYNAPKISRNSYTPILHCQCAFNIVTLHSLL